MANKYLGAKHLSNQTVGELQRTNNYLVEIAGLPEEVSFLVTGIPLPQSENEVITIKMGNSQIKLPGAGSFSNSEMTLLDSVSLDTEKTISDWRDQVWDSKTARIGKSIDYKKDATITEFTPDGEVGRIWKLEGVWPSAFKPGDLAADSSDVKKISVTLEYDRAYRL